MPRPATSTSRGNNHNERGLARQQSPRESECPRTTISAHLEHLRTQLCHSRRRDQSARVAQLQSEIKAITTALAESGVDAHNVYIRPLPDIIIAQVRNRCIEVDPCIMRNTDKLTHALMHEREHLDGIFNEAIVELRVQTRRRVRSAFYLDDVAHMDKILKYIDLETLTRYCKQRRFTELYKLYRQRAHREQRRDEASHTEMSDAELLKNFRRAFPELRASGSRKMRASKHERVQSPVKGQNAHKKRGRE